MRQARFHAERGGDGVGKVDHADRLVRADVEDLVLRGRDLRRPGEERRDIVDVREGPRLRSVAEDRHRFAPQATAQEDADHVAMRVGEVLAFAVDVVRTEDGERQPEHLVRRAQVELAGVLGDPVRILGPRHGVLAQRELTGAVHGDARGEHEMPRVAGHGGVDEVHRRAEVGVVVEAARVVAQPLGRVRREMLDDIERPVLRPQRAHERRVPQVACDERHAFGDIAPEAAGQVIRADHAHAERAAMRGDVRADEAGRPRDQRARLRHGPQVRGNEGGKSSLRSRRADAFPRVRPRAHARAHNIWRHLR